MIGEHSGAAGIAHWVNTYFRLKASDAVDKRSDFVTEIKLKVDDMFAGGRTTSLSDDEMEHIIESVDPKKYEALKRR